MHVAIQNYYNAMFCTEVHTQMLLFRIQLTKKKKKKEQSGENTEQLLIRLYLKY